MGLHVLVIDQSKSDADKLTAMFTGLGHFCKVVKRSEAKKVLKGSKFALLTTSYGSDVLSCVDTANMIRTDPAHKDIANLPMIFHSYLDLQVEAHICKGIYLPKPGMTKEKLRHAIKEALALMGGEKVKK